MLRAIAGSGVAGLTAAGAAAMLAACAQTISGFGMNLILAPGCRHLLRQRGGDWNRRPV